VLIFSPDVATDPGLTHQVTIGEAQDTGHCLGPEAAEARRGHHALIMIPERPWKARKNPWLWVKTNFFDFLCWDQHPFMKFMSYFDLHQVTSPGHYGMGF